MSQCNPFDVGEVLPTLTSPRVRLRWITADDASDVFRVFSDPEVTRFWSFPAWTQPSQASAFIDRVHRLFSQRVLFQWGLTLHESEQVIGTCTLASLDPQNKRAELGFALASPYWKQGLMSEALRLAIQFGWDQLRLERLEADIDPHNSASLRIVQRLGFQKEGYLRERWIVDGKKHDTVLYGLLRREWPIG